MKQIDVLGVVFDNIDISEAVERALSAIPSRKAAFALVMGAQQTLQVSRSPKLMRILEDALLILPGDRSLFAAAGIMGLPLSYKMGAQDFSAALLARISGGSGSVFLLTDVAGIAQRAADDISYRFPGINVVGAEDIRYLQDEEILEAVNRARPDMVILSMDFYMQMRLIHVLGPVMDTGLILGIGRAMEAYTVRRRGDSFFVRLKKEPGRVLRGPYILLAAVKKRIFG